MLADVLPLLHQLLRLQSSPLLLVDNGVHAEGEIAFELGHACVGLLHLFADRLVHCLRLLHLLLECLLQVLDLLVHSVQKLELGSDRFDQPIHVLPRLHLHRVETVHDLNGHVVYASVELLELGLGLGFLAAYCLHYCPLLFMEVCLERRVSIFEFSHLFTEGGYGKIGAYNLLL